LLLFDFSSNKLKRCLFFFEFYLIQSISTAISITRRKCCFECGSPPPLKGAGVFEDLVGKVVLLGIVETLGGGPEGNP
jgi:hypothetical protein